MASSRIKVSTAKLLEVVKARRVQMEASHAKDIAAYASKSEGYRSKVVETLRKAAERIENGGDLPDCNYSRGLSIPCRANAPGKPTLSTTNVDRLIQTLELASDDTVTLTADDAAKYLG